MILLSIALIVLYVKQELNFMWQLRFGLKIWQINVKIFFLKDKKGFAVRMEWINEAGKITLSYSSQFSNW